MDYSEGHLLICNEERLHPFETHHANFILHSILRKFVPAMSYSNTLVLFII